jgi:hypothetical protein
VTSEPPPSGTSPPSAGQVSGWDAPLRVGTLELFFGLVFAFTLTQLSTLLDGNGISATSIVQVLLVFGVLWWMYGGYAWLINIRSPDRAPERTGWGRTRSGWPAPRPGTGPWQQREQSGRPRLATVTKVTALIRPVATAGPWRVPGPRE